MSALGQRTLKAVKEGIGVPAVILAAGMLVFSACSHKSVPGGNITPLVKIMLSDTAKTGLPLLKSFDDKNVRGSIAVVGEFERCALLSELFLTSDSFDNIDGIASPDGLPDFAGECIDAYPDLANTPYSGFLEAGNEVYLSEIGVRNFFTALDTSCRVNSFDAERVRKKRPAKVVVMASPYFSLYGQSDIDSLFSLTGVKVPVITGVDAMLEDVFSTGKGPYNVGVLTQAEFLSTGLYTTAFERMKEERGDGASQMCIFSRDTLSGNTLFEFLDMYSASGTDGLLSSLLLDDYSVTLAEMSDALERINAAETEEMLSYKKMLAPDFRIIDAHTAIVNKCYRLLREKNIFTHDIAFPSASGYISVPVGRSGADFTLAPGHVEPDYVYCRFTRLMVGQDNMDFLMANSPKTYNEYVQD